MRRYRDALLFVKVSYGPVTRRQRVVELFVAMDSGGSRQDADCTQNPRAEFSKPLVPTASALAKARSERHR
jgi:hypothetical protein